MADDDDLDYSDTNVGSAQTQSVRKHISIKLKGKGRGGRGKRGGRGRRSTSNKKTVIGVNEDDSEEMRILDDATSEKGTDKQISDLINYDDVISKLEASPFSPMDRSFPEPLHQNKKLQWKHKVTLIGEKVIAPTIHCCEKCSLPILNYGRMMPCKHVSCHDCAKKSDKVCLKCNDKVQRVEQAQLGSIFMCTFGGAKYGPVSCGRTYLSERDLQAHINHRHLKPATSGTNTALQPTSHVATSLSSNVVNAHLPLSSRDPRDPRSHMLHDVPHSAPPVLNSHIQHPHRPHDHRDQSDHPASAIQAENAQRQYPHSPASYPSTIPVSSARPNLITVPIQDDSSAGSGPILHSQQPHPAQYVPAANATNHPMPPHAANPYPPPHAYPPHAMQNATPAYSQAPPPIITTQAFTPHAPTVHHPPPQSIHPPPNTPASLFTTPPPNHHLPPVTYTVPSGNPLGNAVRHLPPPQRFPGAAAPTGYKEQYPMQPWNPTNVPPPARNPLPPPSRAPPPTNNHPHIPPRGPAEASYRTPYYQ